MREDLPVCIKMEAGITPGLTVNTHAHLLSASALGQNHWQVGHFQAQRDSFAPDLKIADRLQHCTEKKKPPTENVPEAERWKELTAPSMDRWYVPLLCWSWNWSIMDGLWGWELYGLVYAGQICSAACVDGLIEAPLHVERIIWDDFIPFNWESRNRLRQGGKTGPNHSDVGSFHLRVRVNAPARWSGNALNSSQTFDSELTL